MYGHLKNSKNILISGCGGGYDIFCGLDLCFNLLEQNKKVILGNYSFTKEMLLRQTGKKIHECCYLIDKESKFDEEEHINEVLKEAFHTSDAFFKHTGMTREEYIQMNLNPHSSKRKCYFPEYRLFQEIEIPIYCFTDCGIKHLVEAYDTIIDTENIDTIILVDGGTDSLMVGTEKDEKGQPMIGTPFEDISSIIAVHHSKAKNKYLYCLGFNVDRFSVSDESFLKNTSNLIKNNYFIGAYMLNKNDDSTKKYIETFMKCDPESSIVNSHIVMSLNGEFGDYAPEWLRHRTDGVKQYIHPLMGLYWIYDLEGIYRNLKYDVDKLKDTTDGYQVSQLLKL